MRNTVLFIAMSLDGYIADQKGNVDWLVGQNDTEETKDTYSDFVKDIDTIVMGWNTYHQIITELSPDTWAYSDFTTYVVTHNNHPSSEIIRFTDEDPTTLVKNLQKKGGKNIWICGGANLVQQLVNDDLIDVYHITIIPTILGSGIPLFQNSKQNILLKLVKAQSCNGMIDLIYTRRSSAST